MQPMDVSFSGSLKTVFKKKVTFLKSHPAEKIAPYDVVPSEKKTFNNIGYINKEESGITATGIFPKIRVFSREDFVAAEIPQQFQIVMNIFQLLLLLQCTI